MGPEAIALIAGFSALGGIGATLLVGAFIGRWLFKKCKKKKFNFRRFFAKKNKYTYEEVDTPPLSPRTPINNDTPFRTNNSLDTSYDNEKYLTVMPYAKKKEKEREEKQNHLRSTSPTTPILEYLSPISPRTLITPPSSQKNNSITNSPIISFFRKKLSWNWRKKSAHQSPGKDNSPTAPFVGELTPPNNLNKRDLNASVGSQKSSNNNSVDSIKGDMEIPLRLDD